MLAYIPGLVIWFMMFTLVITRYRELPREAAEGRWPQGEWPAVTILIAAFNESEAIVRRSSASPSSTIPAGSRSSWPTTTRPTTPATRRRGRRSARLRYRRVLEAKPGKHHALNAALATVTTPLVVTVDADTHVQRESLTRWWCA